MIVKRMRHWWWVAKAWCIWHHADWWAEKYSWTHVNREDMPDRMISKRQFWRDHSPMNSGG